MQQVNLYHAQYPPKEPIKVSGKLSAAVVLVIVVLIAGISAFYWKIETLRKEYETFKQTSSLTKTALTKVKASLNESAKDDKLKIDLLNIKQKLKHKQALKNRLAQESSEIATSFHQLFVALSNQDVTGLWLREIEFSDKGQTIILKGTTTNAALFTQYIQNLSHESVFSGVSFTVLQLNNDDTTPDKTISFILSTDELPDAAAEMLGGFQP